MEKLSKSPFEDDVVLKSASMHAEGQRPSVDTTAEFQMIPTVSHLVFPVLPLLNMNHRIRQLEQLAYEFLARAGNDIGSEEGLFSTYLDIAEQSLALEESPVGSSVSCLDHIVMHIRV